ncbi:hypothetical protein ACKI1H_17085 [Pseudomonas sp. YH-1]|uniref:hypothetical protein n=1 Tax=Pseudomonas sp. YH-1 TaxID=3384787 RepID=UPI003F814F0D
MSRFASLRHSPHETRAILRERFASKLSVGPRHGSYRANVRVVEDEVARRFLAGLVLHPNSEWSTACTSYNRLSADNTVLADLEAAVDAGWLRCIWGRVGAERSLRYAIAQSQRGDLGAVQRVLSDLHCYRLEFEVETRHDPGVAELVESFASTDGNLPKIVVRTPEWVAARLWEDFLQKETSPAQALRRWVDCWKLLECPSLVPRVVWSDADAEIFQETVLTLLFEEPELLSWEKSRDRYLRQVELAPEGFRLFGDIRPTPCTAVEKALWTQSRSVEGFTFESYVLSSDLVALMRILLSDVVNADHSPAPYPLATRLVTLAIDRAVLFNTLLLDVKTSPSLLADLVLDPRCSGLVCLVIAQWASPSGGWERELLSRTHLLDRAEAFDDAVSILGEHLRANSADVQDVATLLRWFHERAPRAFIDDAALGDSLYLAFKRELATCKSGVLIELAESLSHDEVQRGLGEPAFAAVLDLCVIGALDEQIDADAVVRGYAGSIASGSYSLETHRIGSAAAAALGRVSLRDGQLRQAFLYPLDVRARLNALLDESGNEYIAATTIARSIRAHIRILCRATVGSAADVAEDLFQALISAVKVGAIEHKEKGRVAAFAPREESRVGVQPQDRPLAFDLAAVLGKVNRAHQERLLAAILETDEPLLLAQILQRSPSHLRLQIEQRIADLAPGDAGAIYSLPEMQARITQLIAAGAAKAAMKYMEAEEQLRTWGQVPGRELERFQNNLQILCLHQDWDAIARIEVPAHFSQVDRQQARESLEFTQAISALNGINGSPMGARSTFAQLFSRRPSWAVATNWFAAALRALLGSDGFCLLEGKQVREGQQILMEAQGMTSKLQGGAEGADEAFECNRALLLLALSEPAQAQASLAAVTFTRLQDTASAYRAVALARMGQKSKATTELDTAEHACGRTPILAAARSHIASGAPYLSVPEASIYDSLRDELPSALARFLALDPQQQAQMLTQEENAFESLLIEFVRAAGDALISLVPMMKGVCIDSCEDDLNAFIQQILAARVRFLGWTVVDQSKGGFTAKGNPGERDLQVMWGSTTLSVIEALICERSVNQNAVRANVESHFQKLLGYSTTRMFFHLSYAYLEDKVSLLSFLETACEAACPPEFTYLGQEALAHVDSRPPGFVARYQGDFGEVKVVFLILNLGQQRQKGAAKVAATTKVRKAPAKASVKAAAKPKPDPKPKSKT